jgi:hypothetical protein
MNPPPPNRRVRLALWWMLYRVPIDVDLGSRRDWQVNAALHLKWRLETFDDLALVFPRHWQRMLEKRSRRLAYARMHDGRCPDGWTPPAPGEIARNPPWGALARRHPLGMIGVLVQYGEAIELNTRAKPRQGL